jgi:hypothetical protein
MSEINATSPIEPTETRPLGGGTQRLYRFDNNFGASVVQHSGSYGYADGQWELAVLDYRGERWELTYDTPITDDVIGWLPESEVQALLVRIRALDSEGREVSA